MGTQCVPDLCGDGTTNNAGAEACDDGSAETGSSTTITTLRSVSTETTPQGTGAHLTALEFCGDGIVNNNNTEECDDANNATRDGYSLCRVEFCGDGAINNN
eukprot:2112669-Rhodomonas_salina.1